MYSHIRSIRPPCVSCWLYNPVDTNHRSILPTVPPAAPGLPPPLPDRTRHGQPARHSSAPGKDMRAERDARTTFPGKATASGPSIRTQPSKTNFQRGTKFLSPCPVGSPLATASKRTPLPACHARGARRAHDTQGKARAQTKQETKWSRVLGAHLGPPIVQRLTSDSNSPSHPHHHNHRAIARSAMAAY